MKKKFDCVAMKHAIQARIRREVAGMTPEQELAYFRKSGDELRKRIAAAKRRPRQTTDAR